MRWGLLLRLGFLVVPAWIVLCMVVHANGPAALFALLDAPFELVCHRIPERIASIDGVPMPLCSRCAGIWVGFPIAVALAWPRLSPPTLRWVAGIAVLVMLVDIVTQDAGMHPVSHPTRALTGLLFGVPLGGALGAWLSSRFGARPW